MPKAASDSRYAAHPGASALMASPHRPRRRPQASRRCARRAASSSRSATYAASLSRSLATTSGAARPLKPSLASFAAPRLISASILPSCCSRRAISSALSTTEATLRRPLGLGAEAAQRVDHRLQLAEGGLVGRRQERLVVQRMLTLEERRLAVLRRDLLGDERQEWVQQAHDLG